MLPPAAVFVTNSLLQHTPQFNSLLSSTLFGTDLTEITLSTIYLTFLLLCLGGELLQILSQQDQAVTDEDVGEPVAGAAAHLVVEADGAPTDGRDEELQGALAAETQHKVRYPKHLHNVEMRFYRPQTFLSSDFQCRDDVSELKQRFQDCKELARCSKAHLHCSCVRSHRSLVCATQAR